MTDTFNIIEKALVTALSGNANLVALVGSNIYDSQAPQGTVEPFVVFQYVAGGAPNDNAREALDVQYRVECISQTQATARLGAAYVDAALHNQELTPGVAGWTNYRTERYRLFNQVDNLDGKQWNRKGAFYRIRMSKQF